MRRIRILEPAENALVDIVRTKKSAFSKIFHRLDVISAKINEASLIGGFNEQYDVHLFRMFQLKPAILLVDDTFLSEGTLNVTDFPVSYTLDEYGIERLIRTSASRMGLTVCSTHFVNLK